MRSYDPGVAVIQKWARALCTCVESMGSAPYRALRFFLIGLEPLYGFNSACCTCKNKQTSRLQQGNPSSLCFALMAPWGNTEGKLRKVQK